MVFGYRTFVQYMTFKKPTTQVKTSHCDNKCKVAYKKKSNYKPKQPFSASFPLDKK